jgi:hypothetical protein
VGKRHGKASSQGFIRMKALSSICAAIVAMIVPVSGASAFNAPKAHFARISEGITRISEMSVHHRHRRGDIFSNWCAYNCYRVSRYARPPLGRYGYSLIPYDQDLPFPYRWDIDASIVDNALALPQYYVGGPLLRAGERRW